MIILNTLFIVFNYFNNIDIMILTIFFLRRHLFRGDRGVGDKCISRIRSVRVIDILKSLQSIA